MNGFEHGIDHVGHNGFAPLLVIGGAIRESDFHERDLEKIEGVVITDRGLLKNTTWSDLNLKLLGERLKTLKYLSVEFSGKVDLSEFGLQRNMLHVKLHCPKLANLSGKIFPELIEAELSVPDSALMSLSPLTIKKLSLIRPKLKDFVVLEDYKALKTLDVYYARNVLSLHGLLNLLELDWLGLHDCPSFISIGAKHAMPGPTELMLGGCGRFSDFSNLEYLSKLRKVSLFGKGPSVAIPEYFKNGTVRFDIRGRDVLCAN